MIGQEDGWVRRCPTHTRTFNSSAYDSWHSFSCPATFLQLQSFAMPYWAIFPSTPRRGYLPNCDAASVQSLFHSSAEGHDVIEAIHRFMSAPSQAAEDEQAEEWVVEGPGVMAKDGDNNSTGRRVW